MVCHHTRVEPAADSDSTRTRSPLCLRRRAAAFQQGVTGWEPLWVITVEGINYCLSIMRPGLGALEMANGATVAWLRYAGWLITCPVLLMFLTAMTTYGGRKAPVRLVPLLIANQCMIIAGISASAYEGMDRWLMYMVACGCGVIVLTLSIICLYSLCAARDEPAESRGSPLHCTHRSQSPPNPPPTPHTALRISLVH